MYFPAVFDILHTKLFYLAAFEMPNMMLLSVPHRCGRGADICMCSHRIAFVTHSLGGGAVAHHIDQARGKPRCIVSEFQQDFCSRKTSCFICSRETTCFNAQYPAVSTNNAV